MKVILLSDVKNYGKKGDVVEVNDGYARNFLFPRKLAVDASKRSMEILNQEKQHDKEVDEKNRQEAKDLAEKMKKMEVKFELPIGSEGRVFGSISTKQVVEEFQKVYQIKLDKRKIKDTAPLSTLGLNKIDIDLYKGVVGQIIVRISEKKA